MTPALRTTVRPGDVGAVVALHGTAYAREHGFDATFEAYVAGPLAAFVLKASPRERLWLAEDGVGRLQGCVAIVETEGDPRTAQLRWYLVAPDARGRGLGGRLLEEAVGFAGAAGYRRIILWTVSALTAAARQYARLGFVKEEEVPGRRWGVEVVEERYAMSLL